MHLRLIAAFTISLVSVGSLAQDTTPKPRLSNAPLTAEQLAIYRAVGKHYLKNLRTSIDLASRTEPFNFNGPSSDESCGNGLEPDKTVTPDLVVHKLNSSALADARFVLVDPENEIAKIRRSNPQNLIREAAEGKPVTADDLRNSFGQESNTGMLSLSEIVFDKTHRWAAVNCNFFCGSLCGHGETLIFRKAGDDWKIKRACGGWVS